MTLLIHVKEKFVGETVEEFKAKGGRVCELRKVIHAWEPQDIETLKSGGHIKLETGNVYDGRQTVKVKALGGEYKTGNLKGLVISVDGTGKWYKVNQQVQISLKR